MPNYVQIADEETVCACLPSPDIVRIDEIQLTPLSSSDPASHSDFICSGGRKTAPVAPQSS